MAITLDLPPQLEMQLHECLVRHDAESVRRRLADALVPVVEAMLHEPRTPVTEEEFEAVLKELDTLLETREGGPPPPLSDDAVSRAGIYGDHP